MNLTQLKQVHEVEDKGYQSYQKKDNLFHKFSTATGYLLGEEQG